MPLLNLDMLMGGNMLHKKYKIIRGYLYEGFRYSQKFTRYLFLPDKKEEDIDMCEKCKFQGLCPQNIKFQLCQKANCNSKLYYADYKYCYIVPKLCF